MPEAVVEGNSASYSPNRADTLEHERTMANHSSPQTMKLHDRSQSDISLDEVGRIVI
jgi:hypothetical protein